MRLKNILFLLLLLASMWKPLAADPRVQGTEVVPNTRTITAGVGLSGGGALTANLTLALDLSELVNSQTVFDGSQASRTITYNLSGTDPVWTIGSSSVDLTTGTLKVGGTSVNDAAILTSGTLAAARMPALTGDVTTSAGAVATTIASDAVTYAKMQNVSAASKLLGRGSASGSGDAEEITLGTGLSMSGTTLSASGGGAMAATNFHRYANAVNVKAPPYNATGDGSTDDTTALQNWSTNQFRYLPPGRYVVSSPINATGDLGAIYGDGQGTSVIAFSGTGFAINTGTNRVSMSDFTIDGGGLADYTGTAAAGTRAGIYAYTRGARVLVENIELLNLSSNGIHFSGSSSISDRTNYVTINNVSALGCWRGFLFPDGALSEYSKVMGITAIKCRFGIEDNDANNSIVGARITDCWAGLYKHPTSDGRGHSAIVGGSFNHCTYPIYFHAVLTGGVVSGAQIQGGGTLIIEESKGVLFVNNICELDGVTFAGGGLNRVMNNTFAGTLPTITYNSGGTSRSWAEGNLDDDGIAVAFSPVQTLAAAGIVRVYAPKIKVAGSGGAVTSTATPSVDVTDIPDGTEIFIQGTDNTNTLTLQDESGLSGSKLELGAASRALGLGDVLRLEWDATAGKWFEAGFVNN